MKELQWCLWIGVMPFSLMYWPSVSRHHTLFSRGCQASGVGATIILFMLMRKPVPPRHGPHPRPPRSFVFCVTHMAWCLSCFNH